MSKFPVSESETVALANEIATGLDANALTYAAPPVTFDALNDAVTGYITARDAMVASKAASKTATVTKNVALGGLVDKMKQIIRYAENVTGYNDEQLNLIGWSGRREDTSLESPGQPPLLTVTGEGPGDVSLSWQKPDVGEQPASYRVERRLQGDDSWTLAEMAMDTALTLTEQPRGESLEYRVLAANKAGNSPASNTIAVVL